MRGPFLNPSSVKVKAVGRSRFFSKFSCCRTTVEFYPRRVQLQSRRRVVDLFPLLPMVPGIAFPFKAMALSTPDAAGGVNELFPGNERVASWEPPSQQNARELLSGSHNAW